MQESIGGILRTQVHDGKKAFTAAYFHSGAQLLKEVAEAGFDAQVFGIEGPTWAMLKATEQYTGDCLVDTPLFQSALVAARMAEPYPELLAASSHLLAVAHR